MPNPAKRMTANPARPVARYRPGKAVEESSSSEEDESEDEVPKDLPPKTAQPSATTFPARAQRRQVPIPKSQKEESEDEEGFVTEDEDGGDAGETIRPDTGVKKKAYETTSQGTSASLARASEVPGLTSTGDEAAVQSQGDLEEGSDDEDEDEEEEEEESSSEEEPRRTFQRPTFIRKSDRSKVGSSIGTLSHNAVMDDVISSPSSLHTIKAEELRRKEMADLMIKDKLERDAAARAAGRKGWDDDDEIATQDMVDDTDGLDPAAEYAAWKLRELKRLKRDREAIQQREKEIEEIERRRNLTQAEREAEDRQYLEQQREERAEGRGKAAFLQKYHHKGAFFQDDETADMLRKRDLMSAKFVDEVQNREALPQYMQVRDMTKLGKKGRTRYTDLKGEDTGKWGQGFDHRESRGPKIDLTVDERFRPDHAGGSKGPTGANASVVRDRRDKHVGGDSEGPRVLHSDVRNGKSVGRGDVYRAGRQFTDRDNRNGEDARRSTSPKNRIPPSPASSASTCRSTERYGDGDNRSRRRRSISPYRRHDKRRRVEAS